MFSTINFILSIVACLKANLSKYQKSILSRLLAVAESVLEQPKKTREKNQKFDSEFLTIFTHFCVLNEDGQVSQRELKKATKCSIYDGDFEYLNDGSNKYLDNVNESNNICKCMLKKI